MQGTQGMNGVISAAKGFFGAFRFLLRQGMGWMFLVPVLLWILLAYGLFVVLSGPVDQLTLWTADRLRIEVSDPAGFWNDVAAFLNDAQELVMVILLKLAIAYVLYTLNKYIVLILLSPLLSYASERTEEIVSGRQFQFSIARLMQEAFRGSLIALRNGILEIVLTIGIWLITLLLPIAVPLSVIALFLVSAYFYGYSMFDYIFERQRMNAHDSTFNVNARLPMVLANGALFSLFMKIPLLGITFGPLMAASGAVLAMKQDPAIAPATPASAG